LTSEAKKSANRKNARASTGPRSPAGRAKSATNAWRHGLATPLSSDLLVEAEKLARQIAGNGAPAELLDLARPIAHADLELQRARHVRNQHLSRALSLAGASSPLEETASGSGRAAMILGHVQPLLAIDRYEQRARSRRRKALRAFMRKARRLHFSK